MKVEKFKVQAFAVIQLILMFVGVFIFKDAISSHVKWAAIFLLGLSTITLIYVLKSFRYLMSAIEIKNDFIAIASHELKTPLSNVILRLDLIRKFEARESQKESISKAIESLNILTSLVNDLLDMTRIQQGRFTIMPTKNDFIKTVKKAISQFPAEEIRLISPDHLIGEFDDFRICQVVINLLSNAVKYGNEKPIEVKVDSPYYITDPKSNHWSIRCTVKDHGIGIPVIDQPNVFEKFKRVGNPEKAQGLGLGLHIAKQIVVAHGGRIAVKSNLDDGSTFVFVIPIEHSDTRFEYLSA